MRRAILLTLALTVAVSACTTKEREEWSNGPLPKCDTTSRGRLLLMAQSIPEATLIPCIGDLLPGMGVLPSSHPHTHQRVGFHKRHIRSQR